MTNKAYHKTTNNILAIFESAQSASRAIQSSPITIPLPLDRRASSQETKQEKPADDQKQPSPAPARKPRPHPTLHPWPNPQSSTPEKPRHEPTLRFTINPSTHNHEHAPSLNPFSSYFVPDETSFPYGDLTRQDPAGSGGSGKPGGLPVPAAAVGDCLMGRKGRMSSRRRGRIERQNERMGGFSLWGLFREGEGGSQNQRGRGIRWDEVEMGDETKDLEEDRNG